MNTYNETLISPLDWEPEFPHPFLPEAPDIIPDVPEDEDED